MASSRDFVLWLRFQRRANALAPRLRRDILAAYNTLRDALSDAELVELISAGRLDALIDRTLLDAAFLPVRQDVVESTRKGFDVTVKDLPKQARSTVGFDILNPRVVDAIRTLDSRVINTLKDDVRDAVRAYVENGIRDGKHPRTIARDLRSVIGMSPTQAENMAKYEAKLRGLKRPLAESAIDRKLASYQRRAVAINAETNARTATVDSLKLGQHMSWDDAIAKGVVRRDELFMRWVTVGDDRVRDEHVAMNGEEIPYGMTFSNGETIPGESTYNCRCVVRYVIRKNSQLKAA